MKRLLKRDPESKIIILTVFPHLDLVQKAMQHGAMGYVLKDQATEDLPEAIRAVCAGRRFLSPEIADAADRNENIAGYSLLSEREREILKLIGSGLSSREIAEKLHIAVNTVRVHTGRIMNKLDIRKREDLVLYAVINGLAGP